MAGTELAPHMVEWYNSSFYGEITQMIPNDPYPGYMVPPLDGIWATAPFFHNGSVPDIKRVEQRSTSDLLEANIL